MSENQRTIIADTIDVYLKSIARFEPEIAMTDAGASHTSIAISLKRIADLMEKLVVLVEFPLTKANEDLRG